ncbi:MAG: SpoIIE family protein phosphatase [Cyclobacteriaceae bacterium]|nr:SpoIIE family protein phosphatase [Cyclobacteriaceae bacterium HetDA_MAG_MS6]
MLGFLRSSRDSSEKLAKHSFRDLLLFLADKVQGDSEYESLTARIGKFVNQSREKQLQILPETYLLLEQYVTELDGEIKSREDVRADVLAKFPWVNRIQTLQVIFIPHARQPIELSKIFIASVLARTYQLLGSTGDKMLINLSDWIKDAPDHVGLPIPFELQAELPKNEKDWFSLLSKISHKLYQNLENKFSENFTGKIYEKSYQDIAEKYKGLEDFEMTIRLLPMKLLDAAKVNLLSQKNKQKVLIGQVDDLTALNRKITQQAKELQEKNEIISAKNREITESIDYAKRIQFSRMPDIKDFNRIVKESFIFFKPRDIVSGDFYWFKKLDQKDPKYVIAAADCTGHGVPGALMSMIGIEQFERIVSYRKIADPCEIATRLHKSISKLSKRQDDGIQDGMDLSICTLHSGTKKLEFSGAKNNLIFFQRGNMKIFKGDRHAIGEVHDGHEVFFTKQSVKLNQPTTCYLFSDGFEDQIGGNFNRKYKRVRFYKLLEKMHELPMQRQKEILEQELHHWMNPEGIDPYAQIDDILVMGFKIEFD